MKRNLRKEKAITLIALIITIIVLLILAGVTIATLTGDNGLLTKTINSDKENNIGTEKEKIALGYNEYIIKKYTDTNAELTVEGAINVTAKEGGGWTVTFTSGRVYDVETNGTITEGETSDNNSQQSGGSSVALSTLTKDNYGDYIDLGQNVIGTSSTTDDWRILYNDKNGHVYAILADILPNTNPAITAAGLSAASDNVKGVNSTIGTGDFLDKLNSTTAWQSLIPESLRSTCQVKGAATAEMIMLSYNEKNGTSFEYTDYPELTNSNDNSLYVITPNVITTYWFATLGVGEETMYVLYAHQLIEEMTGEVETDWDTFEKTFTPRYDTPVRPIVSLPSDIQVTKNGEAWTIVQ